MTPECRRVDERLLDLVYEELEGAEREELRAHVAGCGRCSDEVESLSRTRAALRALPDEDPPSAITTRLMHEAAARRTWAQKIAALFVLHPAWSLGAAAAAVLLVSLTLFHRSKGIEEIARPGVAAPAHEEVAVPRAQPEAVPAPPASVAEGNELDELRLKAAARRGRSESQSRASSGQDAFSYSARPPASPEPVGKPRGPGRAARKKSLAREPLYGGKGEAFFDDAMGGAMAGGGSDAPSALERRAASAPPAMPAADEAPAVAEAPHPAETIHKEGDRLRRKGDCGSAIKLYERVILDFPSYSRLVEVRRSLSTCRQALRVEGEAPSAPAEAAPATKPAD